MIADHMNRYLPAGGDGATEEGLGGGEVTVLSQQNIHHLPVLVDRPIQVALLGATEEEYFVDPPAPAEAPTVPACLDGELRAEGLGPAEDRGPRRRRRARRGAR
jgi:hypothetical protein